MRIDNELRKSVTKKFDLFSSLKINRYSNITLPSYRHVPGLTPHPINDPRGHSFGKSSQIIYQITEKNWKTHETFLYAIDLFNYKYYWECHEHLEDLWKIEDKFANKIFFQGIIQVSAAFIKWIQGNEEGMKKLQIKGLLKMKKIMNSSPVFLGINIFDFIKNIEEFFNSKDKTNLIPPLIILQGL